MTLAPRFLYRETFMEMTALKDYLNSNGVGKHDRIAVFYPINSRTVLG